MGHDWAFCARDAGGTHHVSLHGKPVVAFRVGGIPEVLGASYPLYPFGNITAAAAALDGLVQDPNLARELGEQSGARVREMFSADRVVPQYEALYRRIVAGERRDRKPTLLTV